MKRRLQLIKDRFNRRHMLIIIVAVIGVTATLISNASTFSISVEPENGVTSGGQVVNDPNASNGKAYKFGASTSGSNTCGKSVANYNYQVPFGNAVWNQPICNLPRHPRSADYANRLYRWGNLHDGTRPADDYRNGLIGFNPDYPKPTPTDPTGLQGFWTREVYLASKATTEKQVISTRYPSNFDGIKWNSNNFVAKPGYVSKFPDTKMPWNPDWKTGLGNDSEMFILDDRPNSPTQGNIYTIWGYKNNDCLLYSSSGKVCGASIGMLRDHYGNIADYRTFEGYIGERGVGLSYYATLVTPDEILAGEIRHAMGITIPNVATGPICTTEQLGTTAEGNDCGTAVAPASKFEHGLRLTSDFFAEPYRTIYTQEKKIPEGMRFGIDITDTQIEAWIASRPELTGATANTARIVAKAIRDYGLMVVDTSGFSSGIQHAGTVNPDNRQKWIDLGLGPEWEDSKNNLLKGLITTTNLYVVDPPTLTCADGTTSKYYCKWLSAKY